MKEVWKEIKYRLIQTLILRYSNFNKSFILYTDASKKSIGIVLYQKDENVKVNYVI